MIVRERVVPSLGEEMGSGKAVGNGPGGTRSQVGGLPVWPTKSQSAITLAAHSCL